MENFFFTGIIYILERVRDILKNLLSDTMFLQCSWVFSHNNVTLRYQKKFIIKLNYPNL